MYVKGLLAQLVERRADNAKVVRSRLTQIINYFRAFWRSITHTNLIKF